MLFALAGTIARAKPPNNGEDTRLTRQIPPVDLAATGNPKKTPEIS